MVLSKLLLYRYVYVCESVTEILSNSIGPLKQSGFRLIILVGRVIAKLNDLCDLRHGSKTNCGVDKLKIPQQSCLV